MFICHRILVQTLYSAPCLHPSRALAGKSVACFHSLWIVHPADMAGFASYLSVLDTKNFKLSQQMQGIRTKRTKQLWNDEITLYSSVRMYEDYKRRVYWFMDVKSNSPKTFSNNNRCPQDNN